MSSFDNPATREKSYESLQHFPEYKDFREYKERGVVNSADEAIRFYTNEESLRLIDETLREISRVPHTDDDSYYRASGRERREKAYVELRNLRDGLEKEIRSLFNFLRVHALYLIGEELDYAGNLPESLHFDPNAIKTRAQLVNFLREAGSFFVSKEGGWEGSCGGEPWQRICMHAMRMWKEEFDIITLTDTFLSLEHNTGLLFDVKLGDGPEGVKIFSNFDNSYRESTHIKSFMTFKSSYSSFSEVISKVESMKREKDPVGPDPQYGPIDFSYIERYKLLVEKIAALKA